MPGFDNSTPNAFSKLDVVWKHPQTGKFVPVCVVVIVAIFVITFVFFG
jgi:hypothetical protein